MAVDIRYLPGQDPGEILEQIRAMPDVEVAQDVHPPARATCRARTRTCVALVRRGRRAGHGEAMSVGRDGASDAISFLEVGIPAVEFGPVGAGHHGPDEWVSIASLARYRRALVRLRADLPSCLEAAPAAARGRRRAGLA